MKLVIQGIALLAIFSLTGVSTFAFVVSAPAVETQLAALKIQIETHQTENRAKWLESIQKYIQIYNTGVKQLNEIKAQIEQGKQQFDYWKSRAGNLQQILALVRTNATKIALEQGTFCSTPNMSATDLLGGEDNKIREITDAVDEVKKMMAGANGEINATQLRATITKIVGQIPETGSAGVSTFAQTSIEDDMAFMNKANQAIIDLEKEKNRIRDERENKLRSGMFTEADKFQYELSSRDLDDQVKTLQLQALLRLQNQMMVANSFRLRGQNDFENARITEQNRRLAATAFFGGGGAETQPTR